MPLIVVEGPDGSGKSTLVAQIEQEIKREDLSVRVVHFGPPAYDPEIGTTPGEQEYDNLMQHIVAVGETWTEDYIIFDRFHMGCPVYTSFYRPHRDLHEGYGELTYEQYTTVDLAITASGGRTYVLAPPVDVLFDRVGRRGDDFLETEDPMGLKHQLHSFSERYKRLAQYSESAELLPYSTNEQELAAQTYYILAGSQLRDIALERDWSE